MAETNSLPLPFGAEIFEQIESAAVAAARQILSGRRILDVEGPFGIGLANVEVGDEEVAREPDPGEASAVVSRAIAVPMIYKRFALSRRRIAAFEKMCQPLNLRVVADAAQAVAKLEEEFIYYGQPDFHLHGLLTAAGRNSLPGGDWQNVDQVLEDVIAAVNMLDDKDYRGPYGLALAPSLYNGLFRRYAGTDLLQIEHLKRLCTRGIVKADIEGGVLVSAPDVGAIVLGQDLQVEYIGPDAAHYNLSLNESLVLRIDAPDAICTITPKAMAE
jgi:uncharacterized linocin/CFP29 family protein